MAEEERIARVLDRVRLDLAQVTQALRNTHAHLLTSNPLPTW
jgi:hypothetical protein